MFQRTAPNDTDAAQQSVTTKRILFVCHANICRSPMAEAVMRDLVVEAGFANRVIVDSAGTFARVGEPAFYRTLETLRHYGVRSLPGISRQLEYDDLNAFDYVLAMDRRNLTFILRHSKGCSADIRLFLDFARSVGMVDHDEVKDPFPDGDYDAAYRDVRAGCVALLRQLQLT